MRVGIFTESYEPIINGVSVCVATLRDELSKRGHEVFIFAPSYRGYIDLYPKVIRVPAKHTWFMRDYPFPMPFAPEARALFGSISQNGTCAWKNSSAWRVCKYGYCSHSNTIYTRCAWRKVGKAFWNPISLHKPHTLYRVCTLCSCQAKIAYKTFPGKANEVVLFGL